ncbi:hypothetical protein ACSNOH_14655 [Streptomyces sp. URMC 127]|uniref:hypothetical protein n=1 Tax=Streptomyces sp. URMC 127 TaxID=3423402 RepID=UPI003F1B138A
MVSTAATALLLTGCSSDDEKKTPDSPDGTATNATDTAQPTNRENGGDFGTAGRLSGNFSGQWPELVRLDLANPSETESYTGTVTVRDCSSGAGRSSFQPPSKSVTVGPNTTLDQPVSVSFSFPQEAKPLRPTHTVCARLTGRSSEMTGVIEDNRFTPPPEPEPNTTTSTPPAPVTPSPHTAPAPGPQT